MHKNRIAQGIADWYANQESQRQIHTAVSSLANGTLAEALFSSCADHSHSLTSEVIRCRAVTWVGTASLLSQSKEESRGNSWHSWQEEIITLWPKAWKTAHLQRTQTPSFITGVRTGCGQCDCERRVALEMGERLNKRGIQKQREARAG